MLVLAALLPAGRASAVSCGQQVINDWADGRIDRSYPAACYRQALALANGDLLAYSSLPADLRAALLNATSGVVPGGQPGKAGAPKYERAMLEQRELRRLTPDIHHRDDDVFFQAGPPTTLVSTAVAAKSTLNLPLPLIILAVVALLLLGAGAVGAVVSRLQREPPRGT